MDHGNPIVDAGPVWFCSDEHVTFGVEAGAVAVGDRVLVTPTHVDPTVATTRRCTSPTIPGSTRTWSTRGRSTCAAGDRPGAGGYVAACRHTTSSSDGRVRWPPMISPCSTQPRRRSSFARNGIARGAGRRRDYAHRGAQPGAERRHPRALRQGTRGPRAARCPTVRSGAYRCCSRTSCPRSRAIRTTRVRTC